jgi:hypothetical protein
VTIPLITAVLIAIIAQFLVGYNTGVMNSPAAVVFPNHSTLEWSVAVAAFAIGGPGGACSTLLRLVLFPFFFLLSSFFFLLSSSFFFFFMGHFIDPFHSS